ncbi:hypothetical protein ACN47E_001418 [Coniothyrium glycines]
MNALTRYIRSFKQQGLERVPTDTVIPLYDHDDTHANRNIAFEFVMQFDEVLDAEKLADALWRLIEKPGWKKLGARMRMNDKSRLEYHIPAEFTKERPPINFTKTKYDMTVSANPVTANLPRGNSKLEIFNLEDPLRETLGLKDNTRLLADWLYADKAQLGLHVCTFNDGTFVILIWIHTLLDAMGRNALLKAWTAMLDGREEDVPEFFGYDSDPLAKLGAPPHEVAVNGSETPKIEDFVLKEQQVGGLGFAKFIYNMIWETFWYPKEHGRVICMPPSYFSALKQRSFKELESLDPSLLTINSTTGKPFLSDGDILMAFTTQLIARSNPELQTASAATRTIHLMNVFGMRDILSTTSCGYTPLLPKDKVYIANCVSSISSLLTLHDFLTMPLGHLAARIRRDLTIQGTRAQLEASQRLARPNGGPYQPVLFGSGDMVLSAFSNWTKAKLFATDFSAAIVTEATILRTAGARGKPVFIHPDSNIAKGFTLRGSGNCTGRDAEGNYWLSAMLRYEFQENMVKLVEEMNRDEFRDA